MADGYALALQAAVILALKADAGVTELIESRVYDQPPQSATRPYIRIGAIEVRPLRSDCGRAATVTFGIEAHSRPNTSGRLQATRCAEAISAALDGVPINLVGFRLVQIQWLTQEVTPDSDAKSYTAIVGFSAIIDG